MDRRAKTRGTLLILCIFLVISIMPLGIRAHTSETPWESGSRWHYVEIPQTTAGIPVRLVTDDEPWSQVVQDVREHLETTVSGRAIRVGLYGHGAFVTPSEVLQDMPFVAALGLSAEMDVMILPQWRFPQRNPMAHIPSEILQELFTTPPKDLGETVIGVVKRNLRQLARDNLAATAHAALRLAAGIDAFHTHHMTLALAAFSNSALVIVRLGELLQQGVISDGQQNLTLADDIRQGLSMRDIVMFGYPLPLGTVTPALRQRVQGSIVNVVPEPCWEQLGGNFVLRGEVENVAVAWAPAHPEWPKLPPRGSQVALLGAFLGGRSEAGRLAAELGRRPQGAEKWLKIWRDTVCAYMAVFEQFLEN